LILWHIDKVSDTLAELSHISNFFSLEALALRKVLLDGNKLAEVGACPHIASVDQLLHVIVQICHTSGDFLLI